MSPTKRLTGSLLIPPASMRTRRVRRATRKRARTNVLGPSPSPDSSCSAPRDSSSPTVCMVTFSPRSLECRMFSWTASLARTSTSTTRGLETATVLASPLASAMRSMWQGCTSRRKIRTNPCRLSRQCAIKDWRHCSDLSRVRSCSSPYPEDPFRAGAQSNFFGALAMRYTCRYGTFGSC